MTQGFSPPRPARGVAGPARPRSPRRCSAAAAGSGGSALCPARPVPPLAAFPRASLSRCFPSPPPLPPSLSFPPPLSLSAILPPGRPLPARPLRLRCLGLLRRAAGGGVGTRGGPENGRRGDAGGGSGLPIFCPSILRFSAFHRRRHPPPFLRPPASPRTPPPRVSPIVHHHAPHRALAVWGVAAVVGVLPQAAGAG